jgi:hypothetical protein
VRSPYSFLQTRGALSSRVPLEKRDAEKYEESKVAPGNMGNTQRQSYHLTLCLALTQMAQGRTKTWDVPTSHFKGDEVDWAHDSQVYLGKAGFNCRTFKKYT